VKENKTSYTQAEKGGILKKNTSGGEKSLNEREGQEVGFSRSRGLLGGVPKDKRINRAFRSTREEGE